jgi:hypothetical protein
MGQSTKNSKSKMNGTQAHLDVFLNLENLLPELLGLLPQALVLLPKPLVGFSKAGVVPPELLNFELE